MLEKVIDYNEKILWEGKPNFLVYVIGNPLFYLFAIVWALFDYQFIQMRFGFGDFGQFSNYYILFFAVHLLPVWIAIIGPIIRAIFYHKIKYVVTDKRLYLVHGLFGNNITGIEFNEVYNLSVKVDFIEKMFGAGTIVLTPDVSTGNNENRRTRNGYRFYHINEPFEVYNTIKKLTSE